MSQPRRWFAPLTGVAAVALFLVGLILWDGPSPGPFFADEIVRFYTQNATKATIGSSAFGLGGVVFLFFIASLWRVLRSAEGPTGWLASVTLGGGIVATAGILMFAQRGAVLAEIAGKIDPAAAQAIHIRFPDLLLTGGMAVLLFASGLAVIRTKTLPRWLGWVALVLGVASVSRVGFAAFMVSWLWIVVVSLLLTRGGSASHDGQGV